MPKPNKTPAIVLQSLMEEYQLSNLALSRAIKLSPSMVRQIVLGKSKLSISIVLRLSKFFGNTPAFWLDLQRAMLLSEAEKDKKLSAVLKSIDKVKKPVAKPKQKEKAVSTKQKAAPGRKKRIAKAPAAKVTSRKRKPK